MSFDFTSVKKQPANFLQINKILQKAHKTLLSAKATIKIDEDACFTLAYESMLKTSLALMQSRGYRPRVQKGHHKTLVDFSQYVLKDKFVSLIVIYDRMRRKRNKIIYDMASVSQYEAKQSLIIAEKYFNIVEKKISFDNPQQKLWTPKK